jgi:transcriptional regulator with XRE-family HTH domain
MDRMDDRAAGAAALKRLRKRRGLSLSAFARVLIAIAESLHQPPLPAVASVQRSVARWESAKPTMPDERHQLLLAHLYARTPGGDLALGAGSDFAQYLEVLGLLGESEQRIAELRTTVLRAATDVGGSMLALLSPEVNASLAAALDNPARTDERTLTGLASVVADVNAQVGSLPMVRLQLLLAPAVEAARRLLNGPVPDPLMARLREVAVAGMTLAGRLAFETRDDTASRALYAEASQQARELAEPWRQADVHMSHALTNLYARRGLDEARRLVDEAVRAARTGQSTLVRARAHALQAELAARAGHKRQAQTALGLAWYDMEADHAGDPAPTSFSPGHLRGFEGVCELYVGEPSKAHDRFARSASTLSAPRERVQQAIVRTDQALARIRLGEPEAAADLLHECVEAASTTGGRVPALRLRRARQELRPWRRENWVADLDDHIMDAFGA